MIRRGYIELGTCRGVGIDRAGAIPWTAMRSWCDLHDLSPTVARHVIAILMHVDAARRGAVSTAKGTTP